MVKRVRNKAVANKIKQSNLPTKKQNEYNVKSNAKTKIIRKTEIIKKRETKIRPIHHKKVQTKTNKQHKKITKSKGISPIHQPKQLISKSTKSLPNNPTNKTKKVPTDTVKCFAKTITANVNFTTNIEQKSKKSALKDRLITLSRSKSKGGKMRCKSTTNIKAEKLVNIKKVANRKTQISLKSNQNDRTLSNKIKENLICKKYNKSLVANQNEQKIKITKVTDKLQQQLSNQKSKSLTKTNSNQIKVNQKQTQPKQTHYLLSAVRCDNHWSFKVIGVVGKPYCSTIGKKLQCSCIKFKSNHKMCKHLIFVLGQVVAKTIVEELKDQIYLSEEMYLAIDAKLLAKLSIVSIGQQQETKSINSNKCCLICFTQQSNKTLTAHCQTCNSYFHRTCLQISKKYNSICVICQIHSKQKGEDVNREQMICV